MWWTVWWPWMLLWTVTFIAVGAAVWILVRRWRARETDSGRRGTRGISLYLNNESVMELYLRGGYKAALRQEVEEKIVSSKDASIKAEFPGVGSNFGKKVDREILRKYIKIEESITVIGIIVDVLDKADDVVYVNLVDGSVESNKALAVRGPTSVPLGLGRLSEFEVYVSVRGRFQEVGTTAETVTIAAPCGRDESRLEARVTCVRDGLRRKVPQGPFRARCLGRVQDWNPDTRELVIDPIAIFQ